MSREKDFMRIAATSVAGLLISGGALAQDVDQTGWKYVIAPYAWGTSIDGKVTVGDREADVSADFGDVVDFVDTAAALRFEAMKKWGFFGDIWFASLSNEEETPIGNVEVTFDQTIAEAGALYAFQSDLVGYFGARYQQLDGELDIPIGGERSSDKDWTDAIIGARYTPALSHRWQGILRADVGGGDSDLTWLAQAGVGYRFSDSWSGRIAYRYLDTDFDEGNFQWDIAQEGLGLGLAYEF
ncbi:outer membrane protein [Thiohalomonas denitrificans]|uniref:outer membrane protein n=1 Tax=Thiohalomonas denitrificans TaxID=415747 RepID=UPI0026EE3289|nr:hypothetical protein [Thiohalomonas denitrificans]